MFEANFQDLLGKAKAADCLVVKVESNTVIFGKLEKNIAQKGSIEQIQAWDPRTFIGDRTGRRLFEEIARRAKPVLDANGHQSIAITLPGTMIGTTTLDGSSRLGIFEDINVSELFKELGLPRTSLFHDAECLAVGEALFANGSREATHATASEAPPLLDTFALLLVDEGVGASLFIDGKPYKGAGVAGHIGRLVVEPNGPFNATFATRGTLELFVARPWVSQNIVDAFLAGRGKKGENTSPTTAFRAAIAAAIEHDQRALSYTTLNIGLNDDDPIAKSVFQEAADYLSSAINALITIMNPPLIMIGGRMVSEIPEFYELVLLKARRNAWAGSWNETTISLAKLGAEAQMLGASLINCLSIGEKK